MRTLASGTRLFVPSLVMVLAWQLFARAAEHQVAQEPSPTVCRYVIAIVVLTIAHLPLHRGRRDQGGHLDRRRSRRR